MSQSGSFNNGAVPPSVPTSFTTDVRDNTTSGPGTAIPAANVLQLLGRDTTQNNDNGIRTDADPNNGNILYVELTNRATGSVTTNNATLTTILTFNLGTTPGVYYIEGSIIAFDSTDIAGAGYAFSSAARTTGAAATEIGTEFKDLFEEAAMSTADIFVVASGNNILVQAQGIAGKTIDWNCYLTYRFVS